MSGAAAQPLISVVIPVYNGSDWLADAVDSALAQTYRNIEVIVVNDGSDDAGATADIIRQYGDQIRAIDQKNGGVAAALNAGIAAMRGQYFSWLSHDDLYLPQKLATQLAVAMRHEDPVIVCGNVTTILANGSVAERLDLFGDADLQGPALWHVIEGRISGCSVLVPKVCFDQCGGFDPRLPTTQDYDLWFRMAKRFRFVASFDYLTQSRMHPAQGSRDPRHLDEAAIAWMRLFDPLPEEIVGSEMAIAVRLGQSPPVRSYPGLDAFARRRLTAARAGVPITLVVDAAEYADGIRARSTLQSFGYREIDLIFAEMSAPAASAEFVDTRAVMRRHGRFIPAAATDGLDLIRTVGKMVEADRILVFVSATRFADSAVVQRDIDRIAAGQIDSSLWLEGQVPPPWGQMGRAGGFLRAAARAGRPGAMVQELAMVGASAPADRRYPRATRPNLLLPVAAEPPQKPTLAVAATETGGANGRPMVGAAQPATRRVVTTGKIARLGRTPLSRVPRRMVMSSRLAERVIGFGEATGAPGQAMVEWLFGIRGQVDSAWYTAKYSGSLPPGKPASLHYLRHGWRVGYDPSPRFSTSSYLQSVLFPPTINPVSHSAFFGWGFGSGADVRYGLGIVSSLTRRIATSPAVADRVLALLSRAKGAGAQRSRAAAIAEWLFAVSGMIDRTWYAEAYPESVAEGADPSLHYLREGWRKGYDPSPRFSTAENATGLPLLAHLNPLSRSVFCGRTVVTEAATAPLAMPPERKPAVAPPTPQRPAATSRTEAPVLPALPTEALLVLSDGTIAANRWSYLIEREFSRRPFVLHGELRADGSLSLKNRDRHWACRLPDQFEACVDLLKEWGVRRIDIIGGGAAEPAQMLLDACDLPFDVTALDDLDEEPTDAFRQLLLRAERIITPSQLATLCWRARLSRETIVNAEPPGLAAAALFPVKQRSLFDEVLRVLIVANGRAADRDALITRTVDWDGVKKVTASILADDPIMIDLPSVERYGQYAALDFFRSVGGAHPHVIWIAAARSAATDAAIEAAMRTGLPLLVTGAAGLVEACNRRPLTSALEDPTPTEIRDALHRLAQGSTAQIPEDQSPAKADFYKHEYLSWRHSDAR